MPEIRQLVQQCLRGDQEAMQALVRHYQGRVFGLCFRMLRHRQDAEDAAQEAFVRMLRSLNRWDQKRELEPWLLAIAANRCRTVLAGRMRRPKPMPFVDVADRVDARDRRAEWLAEEVQHALAHLRPDHRLAFVLFHEQELSYEQIASCLERPLGTVKTWIHRARSELIKILQKRDVLQESCYALHGIRPEAK